MKIDGNAVRPGMVLMHEAQLWSVVKTQHVKPGKGGAFAVVELKNLIDGRKLNERFRSSETVERVRLDQRDFTFLFQDGDTLTFMDTLNYEQVELGLDWVGEERAAYLQPEMKVILELHEDVPIGLNLPETVILTVAETEPAIKGQTATSSYKPAILDNGVRSAVPPFITVGERVVISTEDGSYLKRAD